MHWISSDDNYVGCWLNGKQYRTWSKLLSRVVFDFGLHCLARYICLDIHCGYSLEAPRWGASNEYWQHTFSWRMRKLSVYFGMKKSGELCWYPLKYFTDVVILSCIDLVFQILMHWIISKYNYVVSEVFINILWPCNVFCSKKRLCFSGTVIFSSAIYSISGWFIISFKNGLWWLTFMLKGTWAHLNQNVRNCSVWPLTMGKRICTVRAGTKLLDTVNPRYNGSNCSQSCCH